MGHATPAMLDHRLRRSEEPDGIRFGCAMTARPPTLAPVLHEGAGRARRGHDADVARTMAG